MKSLAFQWRPQNLKQSSTWFDVYLVNVKSSGRLLQIFVAFSECPNFNKKVIEESPSSASARCQDIFYVATIRTLNACSLYQLVNNQNKLYYVFWQKKTKILNLPFYISSQSWKHLPGLWLINLEVKAREREVHPSETLMLRGIHILRKHISSIFWPPI